ncbi:MAG: DivIVA domain-containing protein [Acidimicrobiales bacterium]|nr:DivIVA domain-containing protein [Acidimicrobiales bacterium]
MAYDPHPPAVTVEPELVACDFSVVRQGFDPVEVRAILAELSRALRLAHDREREQRLYIADLERQLADLRERLARHELRHDPGQTSAVDERELTALLGEETGRILEAARQAAAELRARATEQAERARRRAAEVLDQARADAELLIASAREQAEVEAQARRQEVDAEITELRLAAAAEAEEARAEAASVLEAARAEAEELKKQVLTELLGRRRALRSQVEQLNAARERLAQALAAVAALSSAATAELELALPEARRAARAALARVLLDDEGDRAIADAMRTPTSTGAARSQQERKPDEQVHQPDVAGSEGARCEATVSDEDEIGEAVSPVHVAPAGIDPAEAGAEGGDSPRSEQPGLFVRLRQEALGIETGRDLPTSPPGGVAGVSVDSAGLAPERELRALERELRERLARALVDEQEELVAALQRHRSAELFAATTERRERYLDAARAVLPRTAAFGAKVGTVGGLDNTGAVLARKQHMDKIDEVDSGLGVDDAAAGSPGSVVARNEPLLRVPSVVDLTEAVATAMVEGLELAVDAALAGGGGTGKGRFDPLPLCDTARAGYQQVRDTVVGPVARRAVRAAYERGVAGDDQC